MNSSTFVRALAEVSNENVFNPYSDSCEVHDRTDAPTARQKNLRSYLAAVQASDADTIWMGRDLGYRGGRRTGIALTDESNFLLAQKMLPGCVLKKATEGPAVAERTAAEVWALISRISRPPLLWNVFPFHPFEAKNPFSNRRFTSKELATVTDLNAALIAWLGIRRIVAIGQDAQKYASRFGIPVVGVRHPSYGGTSEFRASIRELYKLEILERQKSLF